MINLQELQALIAVLEYMLPEESLSYEESDKPNNHIYLQLRILEKMARRRAMELQATHLLKIYES